MGDMLLVFDGLDEIQDSIETLLMNIYEKCSIDTKVLVTSTKKLHINCWSAVSRYYMLRKLKPKDAAKLFSRLCNQFRKRDIIDNQELMRILEYNPTQIMRIVKIKNEYHCDSLEMITKTYHRINKKQHLQEDEQTNSKQ
eukprot:707135_1